MISSMQVSRAAHGILSCPCREGLARRSPPIKESALNHLKDVNTSAKPQGHGSFLSDCSDQDNRANALELITYATHWLLMAGINRIEMHMEVAGSYEQANVDAK